MVVPVPANHNCHFIFLISFPNPANFKQMNLRLLFFCWLNCSAFHLFSQQLQVENYTPAQGLLDARVIRVFQDDSGLMYFLTWEGISIFDGQRFHNISEYDGESLGLVNDMIQWKKDTCYVFTFQKGVYKLIHNRLIKDTQLSKLPEPNQLVDIGGNHWAITSNVGLFRWNGAEKIDAIGPTPLPQQGIDFVAERNHFLVYAKDLGQTLCVINLASNKVTDSIKGLKINKITGGAQLPVVIGIDGKWVQLDDDALQKGKLKQIPPRFQAQLPAGFTVTNVFSAKNKWWLEDYKKGYLLSDPVTAQKEFYPPTSGLQAGASIIFSDKENNYWFTVFSKQVQKAFHTKLQKVYAGITTPVVGVYLNENKEAFTLSEKNIFLLQQQNGFVTRPKPAGGMTSFFWQGRSWTMKTATLIESERGEVIDLLKNQAAALDAGSLYIGRIGFDKEGRLLIPGVNFFVVEKNLRVHALKLPSYADNVAIDSGNGYHLFGRNGDVNLFTLTKDGLAGTRLNDALHTGGPRYAIHWNKDTFCIGTRYRGILWLVVRNGETREVAKLNTPKGLSNNFVYELVRKNERQMYAATAFGLDEITISNGDTIIQNLSAVNNLFVPFNYVVKDRNEEILANSTDGQLWSVTDVDRAAGGFVPAAWFDEIAMNGEPISDSLHSFSHGENNFRFTVSAPCFTNASSIRFHFLLKGGNRSWEQHSSVNFYSINNLAPGKYTLTVTITYPGKMYPDKNLVYAFSINAPFWKQWWFVTLVVLLAGLTLRWFIRNHYRRKLAAQKAEADKRQAIEIERSRISRDMHDDLGSGLTKIAILSEVVKKRLAEPDKAREQVEKIAVSSRELVDSLQDIIWVLNPKNDTLESLAAYIREFALKYFEPLYVATAFDYPLQFSIRHISEEKRRNVFLTVKETLNNIAKHAWCNSISISIKEYPGYFEIIIKDDGKGFDPDTVRQFANGLKNMQTRIGQAGGDYTITSAPGAGTLTTIQMPV
jgi:signal transduction histidine kinase